MEILVLGSLPDTSQERERYERIIEVAEGCGEVSSPIDTAESDATPEERYEQAFRKVAAADVVVAEMSEPSTGQGMELREAATRGIPIIVVAAKDCYVSGLVRGCPMTEKVIRYTDGWEAELRRSLLDV